MSERITRLEDLARLAGTSIATVSRALREDPAVKPETRDRIIRLAVQHGFPFNRYAAPLPITGRTCIAVAVPQPLVGQPRLADPFLMELLASIAEAGRERDCDILISPSAPNSAEDIHELLQRPQVTGTIFLGQGALHETFNRIADSRQRFVVWGAAVPGQRYCSVGSDNVGGSARATRHLLRLGRRRIVFLGSLFNPEIEQRHEGYVSALREFDGSHEPARRIESPFDLASAEGAVADLLASGRRFDGIVAASDILAFAAVRCLIRRNIRVPEDVSVVGYDNVGFARYVSPALTTVSQDTPSAGRMLVSKLLGASGGGAQLSERIPTEIVVRESCGG